MINIKEVKDRKILCEGRDSNIGFAMLKKVGDNNYETVNPISPCKDFLNEVIFTENTGLPSKAHGLVYSNKNNIFESDKAYMVVTIQQSKYDGYSYSINGYDNDRQWLKDNYKVIQNLLNKFEDKLDLKSRTIIEEANDNYFLVILPIEWTISTYTISMYTLLLRSAQLYNNTDTIEEYLDKYPKDKLDSDLMKQANGNIKSILESKQLPGQGEDIEKISRSKFWSPHDKGIVYYKVNKTKELV